MAARYYDDAIIYKIKKWIPDNSTLRVLSPDETQEFFKTYADDNNDKPFELPMVALSRNKDIELLSTTKQLRSFNGMKLLQLPDKTLELNIIPIKLDYQLDIYTKTYEEGDEYLRNFLFKLINNPLIVIEIPYNGYTVRHTANIRVASTVSDTSSISERLYKGQFTRWTIQFEIQDAFLFSVPYRRNWKIIEIAVDVMNNMTDTTPVETIQVYPEPEEEILDDN